MKHSIEHSERHHGQPASSTGHRGPPDAKATASLMACAILKGFNDAEAEYQRQKAGRGGGMPVCR